MTISPRRDPDETATRLAAWMGERRGARGVTITDVGGPAATGHSHETILFTARWVEPGGPREARLVARVKPTAHTVFPEDHFDTEYRVMRALTGGPVPLPRLHEHEDDARWLGAPFFVMDHVDGRIPPDNPPYTFGGWLADARPDDQERLWWSGLEALAAVHAADPDRFTFLGEPGLVPQLEYYRRFMRTIGGTEATTIGLSWLEANRPRTEDVALCWGDARIANQIFDDSFGCVAVLDWEMATLGDPIQDLAWYCFFDRLFGEGLGQRRLPGIPPVEATAARYEELTGRPPRHLAYYEVFAAFRFAVILQRVAQLMIVSGALPADSDFPTNNFATSMLTSLIGAHA